MWSYQHRHETKLSLVYYKDIPTLPAVGRGVEARGTPDGFEEKGVSNGSLKRGMGYRDREHYNSVILSYTSPTARGKVVL